MATLWREDGSSQDVQPADGRSLRLEQMRRHCGTGGGPVEIVWLTLGSGDRGEAMIIDEDGHARGRAYNARATAIYRHAGGLWPIMGPALVARYEALGTEQERWW